ncbi:MAG: type II secretion system GspH family protein [Cyanobacteria bacterium CAN_BIN43]|nr:type II secretion system GspH family protein [Cyanobacteria bacterium CAN_BIN43]
MSATPIKKLLAPGFARRFSLSLTQKIAASSRRSDQGLTLIEGLVAIVVVSITLVSITPPIFWATGTRVQNRRAEQALQLAQGEIDRVRTLIDQGQTDPAILPPVAGAILRGTGAVSVPVPRTAKAGIVTINPSCSTAKYDGSRPAIG